MDQENRVVVLIDMDCFYCQVEEKLNPELKGKPIAVVQYNPWKGGGIIAVNYVARAMGVTRHMRGDEAKEKCPDIQLPSVPCLRGKADTTKYRDAGKEVAKVLQRFTTLLERASVDEAYLDITTTVQERLKTLNTHAVNTKMLPNTYALGYESLNEFISDVHKYSSDCIEFDYEHCGHLLIGAVIVSEIRAAVYEETGYRCSAGIAHNKTLAKLVCGMNKPNKQTILPKHSVNILYKTLPLKKVKHLGGKFGDSVCRILKINNMGELQQFSEKELQAKFDEKNGTWLYNIARGIDLEAVQARFSPKSIGCCKQFRGKTALMDLESLKKWLRDLGDEIEERLEKDALENNRTPKQMVVSFSVQFPDGKDSSSSRSYNFVVDDDLGGELFSSKSLELVMESLEGVKVKDGEGNRRLKAPIKFLGISVGKFEDNIDNKKTKTIMNYFGAGTSKDTSVKTKMKQTETENEELPCIKKDTINKNEGKNVIFQKFFQMTNKVQDDKIKDNGLPKANDENKVPVNNKLIVESTLDKQESFFAKFLNGGIKTDVKNENLENTGQLKNETNYPISPVCDVVKHEDNDTDDSGSTIDMEINKSISLFQDDPKDVTRVSNMRQLLKSSTIRTEDSTEILQPEPKKCETIIQQVQSPTLEHFDCSECGKIVPVAMLDTHADYHLALKLREEERQQVRKEIKERNNQRTVTHNDNVKRKSTEDQKKATEEQSKVETTSSITNFFVKFNDTTPTETCTVCGKKVLTEKLAEHLDFHEAQRLNRELNRKPASSSFDSNIVKRKRKTVSPVKKPKVPCKPIDSFFR